MAEVTWDPFGSRSGAQNAPQALTCTDTPGSSDWAVFETKENTQSECKLTPDGDSDWQDFTQGTVQFISSECVKTVAETTDSSDTNWSSLTTNHTLINFSLQAISHHVELSAVSKDNPVSVQDLQIRHKHEIFLFLKSFSLTT